MTPFASVALIRRNGTIVFRPPRKERPDDVTQARKAAMRFWAGHLAGGDVLVKVILVREFGGKLEISERGPNDTNWIGYDREIRGAEAEPHIAACLGELGIDASAAMPPLPDVLNINGFVYRREI
ncbi:hypothetical protein RFN29_15035 [Mesorhizobium sp. VK22B]|uniref:Uncharacterized protein n=1 Tax=Mesorhizobium captivum TaxID=3072319 RepID=A0ABU4Z1U0_9HYPH|nr:hypothetical protein [Mesorhizobium sp. VK22B]MDX8492891.1 hypothetical protein [Mesorhizobium sp. VK22B]